MKKRTCTLAAGLVACLAGGALAQPSADFYLFRKIDVSTLCVVPTVTDPNPYFVGSNTNGVQLDGRGHAWVSGFNLNGNAGPWAVVKIRNIFTTPTYSRFNTAQFTLAPSTFPFIRGGDRGVQIAYYRRALPGGGFESRLLANGGISSNAQSDQVQQIKIFDVENDTAPTLVGQISNDAFNNDFGIGLSPGYGTAAPAWDFGPTGQGLVYGLSASPRPLPAFMRFGSKGPSGLVPYVSGGVETGDLDYTDSTKYYGQGDTATTNGPRLVPDTAGATFWRGFDINPVNGNMAGSSNNSVSLATRTGNLTSTFTLGTASGLPTQNGGVVRLQGPGYTINPDAGGNSQVWQNVKILSNNWGGLGDLVLWNVRQGVQAPTTTADGSLWTDVIRVNRFSDGAAVTANWKQPSGSPVTFNNATTSDPTDLTTINGGRGGYAYSLDRDTGVLAVMDFARLSIYLFSPSQPGACTLPAGGGCVLLPQSVCTASYVGGTFNGAGTTCPSGACCSVNGTAVTCTVTSQFYCSGAFIANGTCTPDSCGPAGACCTGSACLTTVQGNCGSSGVFVVGATCAASPCGAVVACCNAGSCTAIFANVCTAQGGTATGSGTTCTGVTCPSAGGICCRGVTCTTGLTAATCTDVVSGGVTIRAGFNPVPTACNTGSLTAPCCYGNFDRSADGVQVADIFAFLSAFFSSSPYAVQQSTTGGAAPTGTPGVPDIFNFLSAWFGAGGCV